MKFSVCTGRFWLFSIAAVLLASGRQAGADVAALPARSSPDWLRSATVYEIFPRQFSPAGNLAGITAKLDELHDLGVTVLWTMPIHPIGKKFRKGEFGSPYSIRDYYAIDPAYGTLADYKKLVAGAHQRGMKVFMDLVANHTAWDSVMMTNKNFYKQDAKGNVISPVPEWSDVAGLNYASPELRRYMIAMMKFWISEAGVDGFRCDAAPMIPLDFWEQARTELEAFKPGIVLLEEGEQPEFLTKAFDFDYSWKLMWIVNDVLSHNASAAKIKNSWQESRAQWPKNALRLRISDDHDETRAIARYGMNGALAASALMFTLDGVPLLYNGMEVGDATESADPALFDKLNICWHPHASERPPFRDIYRQLIQLRKDYAAFRTDRVTWLENSEAEKVVTFLRADETDEFLVAINFTSRPVSGGLKNFNAAEFKPVNISGASDAVSGDLPRFQLDGYGWHIWHRAVTHTAAK
jgi:cyclomaltodextrinase / maltogenic alpha-amylase / neopullulanase